MIPTGKKYENKEISYEIFDDGYMIYLDTKPWVKQREPYGKPMDASKNYEENCLLQIEDITTEPIMAEPEANDIDTVLTELEKEVGINE